MREETPAQIVVTAGLSDYKLATKLVGLWAGPGERRIVLVRRTPLAPHPRLVNVTPPRLVGRWTLLYEPWRLLTLIRLGRSRATEAIVGIQLVLHGVQAALAGLLTGKPSVVSLIGKDVHEKIFVPWQRPVLKWAILQASTVVCMGPRSREILEQLGVPGDAIFELQNHQDPDRFRPAERAPEWDFIFVGQLIRRKRLDALIRAVALVARALPEVRLALVGRGVEERRLQALVARLGLLENVTFLGETPAVEELMLRSRAFILVSRVEALPAAALEAMYCGLPVIISDVCDIPAVFDEENSILLREGTVEDIAGAMRRLAEDEQLLADLKRGALRTREEHRKAWSVERQAAVWEAILARAAAGADEPYRTRPRRGA